jgi:hypothetical protein
MRKSLKTIFLLTISLLAMNACEQVEDAVDDVQKTAALRNVSFTYDSLSTDLMLPEASLSGKTFQELYENNKETYGNAANYSIKVTTHYTADNTKENAADAKFSGMIQDVVFNGIAEAPVRFDTPGFEITEKDILNISSNSEINLASHQSTAIYIFQQILSEEDLDTRISSTVNYDVGIEKGTIQVPEVQKDIPTKASEETKAFLKGLLDSGMFNEK